MEKSCCLMACRKSSYKINFSERYEKLFNKYPNIYLQNGHHNDVHPLFSSAFLFQLCSWWLEKSNNILRTFYLKSSFTWVSFSIGLFVFLTVWDLPVMGLIFVSGRKIERTGGKAVNLMKKYFKKIIP